MTASAVMQQRQTGKIVTVTWRNLLRARDRRKIAAMVIMHCFHKTQQRQITRRPC
jgi:hypothetical protein